jgi:hypothetical protein
MDEGGSAALEREPRGCASQHQTEAAMEEVGALIRQGKH